MEKNKVALGLGLCPSNGQEFQWGIQQPVRSYGNPVTRGE